MLIDYHVHAMAHGEFVISPEWMELWLETARRRNISQLGFSDHNWFVSLIDPGLIRELSSRPENRDLDISVGIEVDYLPEEEDNIRGSLAGKDLDYIIGSVHHIGDWPFDHPDHRDGFLTRDIDSIYDEYYGLVRRMAASGLFDILGHLDLIKVWGIKPILCSEDHFVIPFLSIIKESGMVVEINTGGLRKPAQEIYPARIILQRLFDTNIPITFGSDAHHPDQLGYGLPEAYRTAWEVGYRRAATFSRRLKRWHLLDSY